MKNMESLCRLIEEELRRIAETGFTTANIDTAYKLVDMYKDIKNTEYWDIKSDYYMTVLDEMRGGYSGAHDARYPEEPWEYTERKGQQRDSRGRYSRNDGEHIARHPYGGYDRGSSYNGGDNYARYMDSKMSYRSSKTGDCKQRMMATLDDYMEEFTGQMEEMLRDADCAEERDIIKSYLQKIKGIA